MHRDDFRHHSRLCPFAWTRHLFCVGGAGHHHVAVVSVDDGVPPVLENLGQQGNQIFFVDRLFRHEIDIAADFVGNENIFMRLFRDKMDHFAYRRVVEIDGDLFRHHTGRKYQSEQ